MSRPPKLPTQSSLAWSGTTNGPVPTRTVSTMRFRARWIRVTVLLIWLGTQRLPATIPPSTGPRPTRLISATRRFLRSSIFATEWSSLFAAQTK